MPEVASTEGGDSPQLSTVDFSPFLLNQGCVVGDEPTAAQLHTASQINAACMTDGFLYLTDFGVTDADVDEAFAQVKRLFVLSDDVKDGALKPYAPSTITGFSKFASEVANSKRPSDLKEAFNTRSREVHANDYNGTPDGFDATAERFWNTLQTASRRIFLAM